MAGYTVQMPPTFRGVDVLTWRLYPGRSGECPVLGWVICRFTDRDEWVTWRIAWTDDDGWSAFEGHYFRADDITDAEAAAYNDFGERTHSRPWY